MWVARNMTEVNKERELITARESLCVLRTFARRHWGGVEESDVGVAPGFSLGRWTLCLRQQKDSQNWKSEWSE